jgi:hypothetical protein
MNNMIPLTPFSEDHRSPVALFEVDVTLSPEGLLWLHYIVDAPPEAVKLSLDCEPERADNLWQSTCFEVFVQRPGEAGYLEFNFASSSQWAAYRFSGYRDGMENLAVESAPEIYLTGGESWFTVEASVQLPPDWVGKEVVANVTAVIESSKGHLGYWAHKHPEKQPDFHDPDCFILPLTAQGQS